MATQIRRQRERDERRQRIVTAARDLAEAQGWDAVTVRRLADEIEFSQPVLYGHFDGKAAIVGAVAIEGFADLAAALGQAGARSAPGTLPRQVLRAVLAAYLTFAAEHPAVYDAMFSQPGAPAAGQSPPPASLAEAFGVIAATVEPLAAGRDPAALAEVVWSAVHGIASLTRSGRLPMAAAQSRLDVLAGLVA